MRQYLWKYKQRGYERKCEGWFWECALSTGGGTITPVGPTAPGSHFWSVHNTNCTHCIIKSQLQRLLRFNDAKKPVPRRVWSTARDREVAPAVNMSYWNNVHICTSICKKLGSPGKVSYIYIYYTIHIFVGILINTMNLSFFNP